MRFWLIKFAPFRYSWEDVLKNTRFEIYSVRNAQARNNLREMKAGDEVLFYHSQKENCIMGKMKVVKESHQDPTTSDPKWLSVTFEPVETFEKPVPLARIRQHPDLQNIGLIRQPRLAVMPLAEKEFFELTAFKLK